MLTEKWKMRSNRTRRKEIKFPERKMGDKMSSMTGNFQRENIYVICFHVQQWINSKYIKFSDYVQHKNILLNWKSATLQNFLKFRWFDADFKRWWRAEHARKVARLFQFVINNFSDAAQANYSAPHIEILLTSWGKCDENCFGHFYTLAYQF